MPGSLAGSAERAAGVVLVLLLVVLPAVISGWPRSLHDNLFLGLLAAAGLALIPWRTRPRAASTLSLALYLGAGCLDGPFPDPGIALFSAAFAVLALGWAGRRAWLVAALAVPYSVLFYRLVEMDSWVAMVIVTVPPYAAGTILRLRRETADQLARRAQELEDERELYAEIALRHERARIAAELHDIVGHAISVMVIQAAAGQRLVDVDPVRAKEAFAAISESARQGTRDLERLIDLLGGTEVAVAGGSDLSLVDEVVTRAGRSGLNVTCRFEGDRDGVAAPVAHLAFRVVQESLTNALRYAPGAEVRILISVDEAGRGLAVRVENDGADRPASGLTGTGRGLVGLRERVQTLGGQFAAGATGLGGWAVEAQLPGR